MLKHLAETNEDSAFHKGGLDYFECASFYRLKDKEIICVQKDFLKFIKSKNHNHTFSGGIGVFYEKIAEFIFNSKHETGKVMDIAPFEKALHVKDYFSFLETGLE